MPDLIRHFFALAERDGLPPKQIDQAALDRLKQHRWPGNVRELENLARRLAALYPQETITAAVIDGELAQPALVAPGESQRGDENLVGAVERYLAPYFSGFADGVPPPGLYHRILREIEVPLLVRGAGGDPRQPDPRRRSAGRQPQHAAQENPRPGNSGLSQRRRLELPDVLEMPRSSRVHGFPRRGIVAIGQHCCIKASLARMAGAPFALSLCH